MIQALYIGYLGRAADRAGLAFWQAQANAGADLPGIAHSFSLSDEYQSVYGGLGNAALVDALYNNLFDRAPDAGGRAYWIEQLDQGKPSARLIVDMISGAQGPDRITVDNMAIVAESWTDTNAHKPFVLADAKNAMDSIGKVEGNGVTIEFTSDALLPYEAQLTSAMTAAWAQWGNHGMLDVRLDFSDSGGNTLAFAYARNELLTGRFGLNGTTPVTQTNVGVEINTGKDMNGDLPDIIITIAMNPERFFLYDTTSIFAHEIGHGVGFRTELFDFDQDYSTMTSWDQFLTFPGGTRGPAAFNGPEAMKIYGGEVPIVGYYNATHTNGTGDIMDPSFGQGEVRVVGAVALAMMHDAGVMV